MKLSQYCRSTLFRAAWLQPNGVNMVYAHARDRTAAIRLLEEILSRLSRTPSGRVEFNQLYSYFEMKEMGISQNCDFRIFEMAWQDGAVSRWVEQPLFLSSDQTLIGQWVALLIQRTVSAAAMRSS
ncbi:hypothetical protein HT746_32050 [Burkholderia pyrrocinia]|uniref:hypothetical protein n=1 Tax=Burkholderia pyrrocinia TaxID=60550 RepID=UPI0015758B44|nr:hypothetical protein [Burkholderia pyrrocinia]NTX31693.1 hypothetical protein [Burkholderia pyrrocinia]